MLDWNLGSRLIGSTVDSESHTFPARKDQPKKDRYGFQEDFPVPYKTSLNYEQLGMAEAWKGTLGYLSAQSKPGINYRNPYQAIIGFPYDESPEIRRESQDQLGGRPTLGMIMAYFTGRDQEIRA